MEFQGYRITSPYGMRTDPFDGSQKMHTGIDLVKADKAPIPAFTDGKVVHAKTATAGTGLGGFGNVVALVDPKGHLQFYAHLDSICVEVGQMVKAGQVLGRQGNTGHSAGSHLHYEVRSQSEPSFGFGTNIEPTSYLLSYWKEEKDMENEQKIVQLEARIVDLEKKLGMIPMPEWFSKEFGADSLNGLVNDPTGTPDFWRSLAINLRISKL